MQAKILVFAGSIRTGAFSGKTADAAQKELALQGAEVTRIALADFPLPLMDEDLEAEKGIPDNAVKLARMIAAHDGMLIASPEYNGSIPPLLKNVIDWVSRVSRDNGRPLKPYSGMNAALCSSSNGNFAGIRALNHLRAILAHVGVQVVSEQCSIANADHAFDENGDFRDERSRQVMTSVCRSLIAQCGLRADLDR
ncbi:MAG: NAD(P)H-dependent oxidoreductase [Rhizobiaceae bacterium]